MNYSYLYFSESELNAHNVHIHNEICCFIVDQLMALRDRLTNNLSAKGGALIMTCEFFLLFFFSFGFSFDVLILFGEGLVGIHTVELRPRIHTT